MNLRTAMAFLLGLGVMSISIGSPRTIVAQSAKAVSEGVYTSAQAARGKEAYSKTCESCHKADLSGLGDGMAAPLSGEDFTKSWSEKTLGDLFEKMQAMPPGEETKATDAVRADIMAYVLSVNHYRTGEAELTPDEKALKQIKIDAPHP